MVRFREMHIPAFVTVVANTLMNTDTDVNTFTIFLVAVVLRLAARVHLCGAQRAGPLRTASARECAHLICARRTVHARRRNAIIVIHGAVKATVTLGTNAGVTVHLVKARRFVQAWVGRALVKLSSACASGGVAVSRSTLARERVNAGRARSTVNAWRVGAFVNVRSAGAARVTRGTRAPVRVSSNASNVGLFACGTVLAGRR